MLSPKLYPSLSIGDHEFQVKAFIIVGQVAKEQYDPTPAIWNWEVLQEEDIVVVTNITSVIDGNGDSVPPGGSTTSNDINFTFSGQLTPEGTEISGIGSELNVQISR